jgi:manganese transport protein
MTTQAAPPAVSRETPAALQEPPTSLWLALRQIGPGLILAGSIVGTGELIATTNLGAKVGFAFLWLVVFSCFVKVFVQVELGRHALSSGETTIHTFSKLPGPALVLVWWYVVMTLFTQLQLGAMIGGVGEALHRAVPIVSAKLASAFPIVGQRPELPWAAFVTLSVIALLARGSYGIVEKASTFLVVTFTLVTVSCVAFLPATNHPIHWGAVGHGLTFTIPAGSLAFALAMFGITGVGASELIAYPYWCIEKGYARKAGPRDESPAWAARARGWIRVMYLDAWVSMIVYTVATIAFYFLGAAVLHKTTAGKGLDETIGAVMSQLIGMYAPVLGARAAVGFVVAGVIAVLYSTLIAATAGNARGFADAAGVHGAFRAADAHRRLRWVRMFCLATPILNFLLYYFVKNPVKMVTIGAIAQALSLPMIAGAAIYLRYRRTDKRLLAGPVWTVMLWLSMLAFCTVAVYSTVKAVQKLFP